MPDSLWPWGPVRGSYRVNKPGLGNQDTKMSRAAGLSCCERDVGSEGVRDFRGLSRFTFKCRPVWRAQANHSCRKPEGLGFQADGAGRAKAPRQGGKMVWSLGRWAVSEAMGLRERTCTWLNAEPWTHVMCVLTSVPPSVTCVLSLALHWAQGLHHG